MKLFGSLKELVKIVFRDSGGKEVEVEPAAQSGTGIGPIQITLPDVGDNADTLVMNDTAATLQNKTLNNTNSASLTDSNFTLEGATANLQFNANLLTTARTITVPNVTDTMVVQDSSQTLTNKNLEADTTLFKSTTNNKQLRFDVDGNSASTGLTVNTNQTTNITMNIPDITTNGDNMVLEQQSQTIQNKTLDTTNTITVFDSLFQIQDNSDSTKKANLIINYAAPSTTRNYFLPDSDGTFALDANKADVDLGNLSTTAINTALLPDSDGGQDLGSVAASWGNVYAQSSINLNGVTLTESAGTVTLSSTGPLKLTADAGIYLPNSTSGYSVSIRNNNTTDVADRLLYLNLNGGNRSLNLDGNINLAGAFTTSGANPLTLTTTGTTDVTLPTTGTLSTLAGAESLTNKTLVDIDNQGELRLQEQTGNGDNYVGFSAPDAVTANQIWKLPDGDGTSNQVLKTDGAGGLGWASVTASEAGGQTLTKTSNGNKTISSTQCLWAPYLTVDTGHTYTIDSGANMVSFGSVTVNGTLTINGTSEIIQSA